MSGFERERRPADRRRQADWVVQAATILSVVAWIVAITVLFIIHVAAPERVDFFTHVFGGQVVTTWNAQLLWVAFILLIASLICCIAAFLFNMLRMRRKTDKYRKSVIFMGVVTLLGIVFFIIQFGSDLF